MSGYANPLGLILGALGGLTVGGISGARKMNKYAEQANANLDAGHQIPYQKRGFFLGNSDKRLELMGEQYKNNYQKQIDDNYGNDVNIANNYLNMIQQENTMLSNHHAPILAPGTYAYPQMKTAKGNEFLQGLIGDDLKGINTRANDAQGAGNFGGSYGTALANKPVLGYGVPNPPQTQPQPMQQAPIGAQPVTKKPVKGKPASLQMYNANNPAFSDYGQPQGIQAGVSQLAGNQINTPAQGNIDLLTDIARRSGSVENFLKILTSINSVNSDNRDLGNYQSELPGKYAQSAIRQAEAQYAPDYYKARSQNEGIDAKYGAALKQAQIGNLNEKPRGGSGRGPTEAEQIMSMYGPEGLKDYYGGKIYGEQGYRNMQSNQQTMNLLKQAKDYFLPGLFGGGGVPSAPASYARPTGGGRPARANGGGSRSSAPTTRTYGNKKVVF